MKSALPALRSLLEEARRTFAGRAEPEAAALIALLDGLGTAATGVAVAAAPAPALQPVCVRLPEALALAPAETAGLVSLVDALAPTLSWARAPAATTPAEYFEGHAYAMLVGDGGFVPADGFMLGLFLLAPGLFYPNHAHAADELYYLLSGRAQWQKSGGAFAGFGPGELVAMPSMTPHAIRIGSEPVLILWAWYGDLHGPFVYLPD